MLDIFEMIGVAELGMGRNRERLEITLAVDGLQADGMKLAGDIVSGFFELRRAGGAAAHLGRSQILDVAQESLRVDVRRERGSGRRRGTERGEQKARCVEKKAVEAAHAMNFLVQSG